MITGGAGFIGYHLANKLAANENNEVHIVDNFSRAVRDSHLKKLLNRNNVKGFEVDLLNKEALDIFSNDYEYIYHLAAIVGVKHVLKKPFKVLRDNIILLENMLDFAKKCNALNRFLFASTSEVYAGTLRYFSLPIPTPEDIPLTVNALHEPRTSYMLSKIYGEALCRHSGVPYTIFRPHNFYGPRMGMAHVIPELAKRVYEAENNTSIEVFSTKHKRTFCFIDDAVQMLILIGENPNCEGDVYNIGNQEPEITIEQLAKIIMDFYGKNLKIISKPPTPGSPERRCPDITKIVASIGYRPKVSLKEGIEKTISWYKRFIFQGKEMSAI